MKPGICPIEEITYPKDDMYPALVKFIGRIKQPVADVGELNVKSQYLAKYYNCPITQIAPVDLDYWISGNQKFETIFCFEVVSHLVNPGWFMSELRTQLTPGGVIFLSMPARPRFMMNKHHFHEFGPEHFQKWILDELGLRIVKTARIRHTRMKEKWYRYIGFRPILRWIARIIWNYTVIYEIRFK